MQVSLVMFKADGKRQDFKLSKARTIVGRKNTCDLRIPLSSVSRQHCELTVENDTVVLRDLGSSNGTFHNDDRVQEAVLKPGDEIVIGPVVFTVEIDGVPENIAPVHTVLGGEDGKQVSVAPIQKTSSNEPEPIDEEQDTSLDEDEPLDQELYSPTVDIDEDGPDDVPIVFADDDGDPEDSASDPIAELERLARAQEEDDDR